jgi:hypothetical protein
MKTRRWGSERCLRNAPEKTEFLGFAFLRLAKSDPLGETKHVSAKAKTLPRGSKKGEWYILTSSWAHLRKTAGL